MNSFLHLVCATAFSFAAFSPLAQAGTEAATQVASAAPYHDLVFGMNNADEPFFKDGEFWLGDKKIRIEQGAVPNHEMVAYDDKADKIIVSNDKTLSETDKGAALLQLMDALSVETIMPAAGGQSQ